MLFNVMLNNLIYTRYQIWALANCSEMKTSFTIVTAPQSPVVWLAAKSIASPPKISLRNSCQLQPRWKKKVTWHGKGSKFITWWLSTCHLTKMKRNHHRFQSIWPFIKKVVVTTEWTAIGPLWRHKTSFKDRCLEVFSDYYSHCFICLI